MQRFFTGGAGAALPLADAPPVWFWALPAAVGLLRTLPFLWLQAVNPPAGLALIGVGYLPKDFLSYLAFVRQAKEEGVWIFENPFTTDLQTPRFILLFHWILGVFSSITGLAPAWILEVSRLPLSFVFFWLLWRFLGSILTQRSDRLWACVLVGFSGGIEGFIRPYATALPAPLAQPLWEATWSMYGWNMFASFYNPLWIAAMIPALLVLQPLLAPDQSSNKGQGLQIGAFFFLTYLIHPYTAIFLLAVAVAQPTLGLLLGQEIAWRKTGNVVAALGLPLAAIAGIGRWQAQDAVYRVSAGGIWGPQELPVFWYPITLGLLGLAAIRGARLWANQRHPYRFALLAWVTAVIFLHTSPVLNGYKFVFLLYLPLCIVAAPAVRQWAGGLRMAETGRKAKAITALFFLFAPAVLLVFESLGEVEKYNYIPADYVRVIRALAHRPRGNALVPPRLGNLLPAFTPHRVWVGQWFLTPNYENRVAAYEALTGNPAEFDRLRELLDGQRIRYLVIPSNHTAFLAERLDGRTQEMVPCGRLDLLVLR